VTTRVGFDLTKPCKSEGKDFNKAEFPKIDPKRFL
jgi:hypothetical protein